MPSFYIPYGRQDIDATDVAAVVETLQSEWLTQGSAVPTFEAALAKRCLATHGVATSNATAALHLACLALDVGPGDRVWTSPITFVASANCARYCGASVDFVDIDPATLNLCPTTLAAKLEQAARNSTLPKVVIPVHFAGLPCDMESLARLAKEYGFRIIEDASHAIGASYAGKPIGSCAFSDITIFSFHPVKIITTGEGGMAMTNDPVLARRLQLLRSHGITREADEMIGPSHGPWYYQQRALGFNYRMTDLQAALGLSQLKRLDDFITRRTYLVERYDALLRPLPLDRQQHPPKAVSAHHLYVIRLQDTQHRRAIFEQLRHRGIGVNVHYIPVHLQPDYQELGFREKDFPNAETYYEQALTLPLYPLLTEQDQDYIIKALKAALVEKGD